jgi:hypothetical protein
METFTEPKKMVGNPDYQDQRRKTLANLKEVMVEAPIIELINAFNKLPYCFTLQCCYGHFIYEGQDDIHNLEPLPVTDTISQVTYRIAYVGFCVENSGKGRQLLAVLEGIEEIDPGYIQLCSSEWFWKRQVNSYGLQVQPDRFKHQDRAILDYREALHVENIRDRFFIGLQEILHQQVGMLSRSG